MRNNFDILKRKKSKFGNKFEKTGGTIYHSKKEARYAEQLQLKKLAGEIKEWKGQHCLRLDVDGQHICNYFVDFLVTYKDGTEEYHEVKGFETDTWSLS